MSQYQKSELSNGIRIIHKEDKNYVAHLGIMINTGSRDEKKSEHGLAHMIEHMIFKGTKKRKAFHVLSNLENVGGELNAYTSKEETCFYSAFMYPHYARALELIADITFHSTFPEKEIKKETEVVLDELNAYKDDPGETIYEEFENIVFKNHPLGRNILGTRANIKKTNRSSLQNFVKRTYNTNEMVISSSGNIKFEKLRRLCEKYFCQENNIRNFSRKPPIFQDSVKIAKNKNIHQTYHIMGNEAYPANHPKKNAFILLNNILGGPGMNSRLNMGIREKYGFCYHIESNYTHYSDAGLFSVFLGTDAQHFNRSIDLVYKELNKLKQKKLGTLQFHRAKQQIMGQLAIANESRASEIIAMGKSMILYDTVDTIDEIKVKIDRISAEDIQETANEVFNTEKFTTLTFNGK